MTPLIVFYVRIRRPLVDVLPAWCGGTWKPEKRRRRAGEEVIKRPPRDWDATIGLPYPPKTARRPCGHGARRAKKKRRGR